jgi:hypothetical protein
LDGVLKGIKPAPSEDDAVAAAEQGFSSGSANAATGTGHEGYAQGGCIHGLPSDWMGS